MTLSVPPVQVSSANINRIGFGNANLKYTQSKVSEEDFSEHAVMYGAAAGAVVSPIIALVAIFKKAKVENIKFFDSLKMLLKQPRANAFAILTLVLIGAGVGIGAEYKSYCKMEKSIANGFK